MTNKQYHHASVWVMEHHPRKLLSTWHVDIHKAWKESIREKVNDAMVGAELYKILPTVLEQTSEATFSDLLVKMPSHLQANKKTTTSLQKYFHQKGYQGHKSWRCRLVINTNMYVETFHCTFKCNYLKAMFSKCVDTCLLNFLKFIRDKTYGRTIKPAKEN